MVCVCGCKNDVCGCGCVYTGVCVCAGCINMMCVRSHWYSCNLPFPILYAAV